ncbi:MAG: peptidase [Ignavibacteriales bacterium]|nr:peptidase [Ignavibacteriales bacterium]
MKTIIYFLSVVLILTTIKTSGQEKMDTKTLKKMISQYVETKIKYDHKLLNEREKLVVKKLYQASEVIDEIFLDQVYAKNEELKNELQKQSNELAFLTLKYFNINCGPFDRLNHDDPFYGGKEKPLGANFYPDDMTKEEFENWIKNNPSDKNSFTSEFSIIRRTDHKLIAIPYSKYYGDKLTKAAKFLREAAGYSDNESLKKYLLTRALAFETNDYYESDMAWMDLKDSKIEVVIGPYEVYEDGLFNYKASFESFLTIKDPGESKKLEKFGQYLTEMEKNLPYDDKYKNFDRGSESPIVVVNEIYTAGDAKRGVQTLAFNLPNDERVRSAKGSKKVMIKNVHEAKFEKLLKPIAQIVMDKSQLPYVTFDGFFNHTLMHEMSHGLGPGYITVNGLKSEVKIELKETYSKIEECKADILGMYNNNFLVDKGVYPKKSEKQIWATFLAGIFRSVRFGINEAHGAGSAIIYNFLLEKGGYVYDAKTQKVKVDFAKVHSALKELAKIILTIQATGDYNGAKQLIEKYAVDSPSMVTLRNKLVKLPVDIKPVFQIEKEVKD